MKEKRAAVITRAVTKGLNPNVPMKDSGIEWLGEIPEHWIIKRLKYAASINSNSLAEDTDPNFIMQYIDIGNVDSNGNIYELSELSFNNAPSRARRIAKQGATILSTVRTYLKAIAFIGDQIVNLVVSTGFAVIHANRDIIPKYLFYVLRSDQFINAVVANSEGVGYPAINPSKLGCLTIWSPNLFEQKQIIEFIDQEITKIDKLVSQIQSGIDKLKEYRTALISAAVTGKIDVRSE
jgi:type I restriction enzyme S subunit